MDKVHVLVLQSCQDLLTYRRVKRNSENPVLNNYLIEYCYAIELPTDLTDEIENIKSEPRSERAYILDNKAMQVMEKERKVIASNRSEYSKKLEQRLERKITEFSPSIIIVHNGYAFHSNPQLFINVLHVLKIRHPEIRFGIEYSDGLGDPRVMKMLIDSSQEISVLTKIVI